MYTFLNINLNDLIVNQNVTLIYAVGTGEVPKRTRALQSEEHGSTNEYEVSMVCLIRHNMPMS